MLAYNPDAARAYFAVETRKALEAIEEAASGVALRSVARVLKLFAEGLSGHPVTIRPLDESKGDGSTIALPARMRRYPSKEDNLRMYKVLTAHEAAWDERWSASDMVIEGDDVLQREQQRYPNGEYRQLIARNHDVARQVEISLNEQFWK